MRSHSVTDCENRELSNTLGDEPAATAALPAVRVSEARSDAARIVGTRMTYSEAVIISSTLDEQARRVAYSMQ
jgi:hypothetical protein